MPEFKLHLKVHTPVNTVLDDNFDMVILKTTEGDMGVMPRHESCAVMLGYGLLRAYKGSNVHTLAVLGGFASINGDSVSVVSPVADLPDNIEAALAEIERKRADNVISARKADQEIMRAEAALRRALVKSDDRSYPSIEDLSDE